MTALQLLHERPMHPYEMARLIRERRIDVSLNLKRGSLYHAVERLQRDRLVEAVETSREGRRPERTVYRLTEAGRDAFDTQLRELIADVVYEPPRFMVAAQFLASLPPDEAAKLLQMRRISLESQIAGYDAILTGEKWPGWQRVQVVEVEYVRALAAAELAWVKEIIQDLLSGELTWTAPAKSDLRLAS